MNLLGKKLKGGGIIIGIVDSMLVEMQQKKYQEQHKDFIDEELCNRSRKDQWGEDWKENYICYVYFTTPVKQISFEEYKKYSTHIKEEYLQERYEKDVQSHTVMSIPLNKIELEEQLVNFSNN